MKTGSMSSRSGRFLTHEALRTYTKETLKSQNFSFSSVLLRPDSQSAYFSLIEMSKGLLTSQPGTQSETFWLFPIIEMVNLCSTTLSK